MIKEALQYIVGLSEAHVQEIHGHTYTDKMMHRVDEYYPQAEPIRINTLSGLVEYIKSGIDTMPEMIVEVSGPTRVCLYSQLNPNRERETLMIADARIPDIPLNQFIGQESFCIGLQSMFEHTDDLDLLKKFAGTVEAGTVAEYGDNGVSQKATIRQGIASKAEAIVPNPVRLKPYRSFLEVEQAESSFVFRMKEHDGIRCGLYEADGGAWKLDAMQKIKAYLEQQLEGIGGFTIIA